MDSTELDVLLSSHAGLRSSVHDVRGAAQASVLCWGNVDDEARHGTFDVIIGADVVTTLYDPIALADTIYNLSHAGTKVYISFKERLSSIHDTFHNAIRKRFAGMEIIKPLHSRNRNADVRIIVAHSKKRL